jgi:hypothetical protein
LVEKPSDCRFRILVKDPLLAAGNHHGIQHDDGWLDFSEPRLDDVYSDRVAKYANRD